MSENPSENSEMADVTTASDLLKRAALPVLPGELIAHQIRRAARKVGLPVPRAKSIWYREARTIRAHEIDALRKTVGEVDELRAAYQAVNPQSLPMDRKALFALGKAFLAMAETCDDSEDQLEKLAGRKR